ncbi:hypothetical protein [Microbacterium hydrocarbonoxydans]|uniref:hypothetical protein n=1 Tax=Microbacterium hydrocarbonoxydans TaxID=273678 RepID=UPI000B148760
MTFRYDFAPTPFGDALAVFSDEGIVRFDLSESDDPSVPWLLENVSRQLHAVPDPDPGAADDLVALLDEYFDGEPVRFHEHLALDWRLSEGFSRTALQTITTIAWGGDAQLRRGRRTRGAPRRSEGRRHGMPADAVLDHRAGAPGRSFGRHRRTLRRAPRAQEIPARPRVRPLTASGQSPSLLTSRGGGLQLHDDVDPDE